jgi:minor extracellular serine protease Vpr
MSWCLVGSEMCIRDRASVNEIEGLSSVAVYPNPAASSTNVAIELTNEADVAITVTDLSGKVVYSNALGTVNGTQNVTINTDAISSGAYMVNVSVNGTVSTQKLIVRK